MLLLPILLIVQFIIKGSISSSSWKRGNVHMLESDDKFTYCHEEIASLLKIPEKEEDFGEDAHYVVSTASATDILHQYCRYNSGTEQWDLRWLARQCGHYLLAPSNCNAKLHDPWAVQLWEMVTQTFPSNNTDESSLFAVLVATSRMETRLAVLCGYPLGKAPLFKDMLMDDRVPFQQVFQRIFLPNPGLNLRNLVWHGFLPGIDRCWLAVVLVLLDQLHQQIEQLNSNDTVPSVEEPFLSINDMKDIQRMGMKIRRDKEAQAHVRAWLPRTHRRLFDWTVGHIQEMRQWPFLSCTLLTILLEHALRLQWCHANNRPQDTCARPQAFYVTLDGHGQRQQHDNILSPVLLSLSSSVNKTEYNQWAKNYPTVAALLSDVYMSPYGCNLRASLSHGKAGIWLEKEILNLGNCDHLRSDYHVLEIVWACLGAASGVDFMNLKNYWPRYSYTAKTHRTIDLLSKRLHQLDSTHCYEDRNHNCSNHCVNTETISLLQIPYGGLELAIQSTLGYLRRKHDSKPTPYSYVNLLYEYDMDKALSSRAATRALLDDVLQATSQYLVQIEHADHHLSNNTVMSSRDRKRFSRIVASCEFLYSISSFAVFVALLSLLPSSDPIAIDINKLVERCRMVISTVNTFLIRNPERAFRSVQDFVRGKHTKALITEKEKLLGDLGKELESY